MYPFAIAISLAMTNACSIFCLEFIVLSCVPILPDDIHPGIPFILIFIPLLLHRVHLALINSNNLLVDVLVAVS